MAFHGVKHEVIHFVVGETSQTELQSSKDMQSGLDLSVPKSMNVAGHG